jgi:hypothetical protein
MEKPGSSKITLNPAIMKKFFLLILSACMIYFGCKKNNTPIVQSKPPNPLVADAGLDTSLFVPQPGSGSAFLANLNGKASYDSAGKIVSYSWTEVDGYPTGPFSYITSPNSDSTEAYMLEGLDPDTKSYVRKFQIEVQDDHQNVAYDTVNITINRKFAEEFDGLSWDSTIGPLTCLNIACDTQIWACPVFGFYYLDTPDIMNLCTFDGKCSDIMSWTIIPYVPYDSIKLTNKNLFYSSNSNNANDIANGNDWAVIYASQKAGIDFTQKISIGVTRLQ